MFRFLVSEGALVAVARTRTHKIVRVYSSKMNREIMCTAPNEIVHDQASSLSSMVRGLYAEQIDLLLKGKQSDSVLTTTSDIDGKFDVKRLKTIGSHGCDKKFEISDREAIDFLKERINRDGLCAYSIDPRATESCCSIVVPVLAAGGNKCNVNVNLLHNNRSIMISTIVHKKWKDYSALQQVNHTKRGYHGRRRQTNSYSLMTTMMKYNAMFSSESESDVVSDIVRRISRTNDGIFIFFYIIEFSVAIVGDGKLKSILDNFILKAIDIKRDFAAKEALPVCVQQIKKKL